MSSKSILPLIFYIFTTAAMALAAQRKDLPRVGLLSPSTTALMINDMQEGFRSAKYFDDVVKAVNVMIKAAQVFNIPVYVSEHHPPTYGHTDPSIQINNTFVYEKETYSMATEVLKRKMNGAGATQSVVLLGVEAHICVEQSAMDFIRLGYDVHVLAEGVSSTNLRDRAYALKRMEKIGCYIETIESVLYKLVKETNNPKHDEIVAIIGEYNSTDVFGY